MRTFALLLVIITACGKSKPTESHEGSAAVAPAPTEASAPAKAPAATGSSLALDHMTMLEPDAVAGERLTDADALTNVIKQATNAVIAYDAAHAGALPADVDVVIVVRANATRAWVVGPSGDLAMPDLTASLAKLPAIPVKESVVGIVATLVRAGTEPAKRGPYLPASWKAAAGPGGGSVDDVIEKAWPR
jgi:hypothetical protein